MTLHKPVQNELNTLVKILLKGQIEGIVLDGQGCQLKKLPCEVKENSASMTTYSRVFCPT